jgi:hypothetical protein
MKGVRKVLLGLALLAAPGVASAQPVDVPPTWGGDFWDRPRLTGSWWGLRDELGKKGVVFDADLLLSPQGVLGGGRDTGWEFWGNADYTLNVDTGKLGLSQAGSSSSTATAAGTASRKRCHRAVNTFLLFPKPTSPAPRSERDVHAVSRHQVRPVRGQDLHARGLRRVRGDIATGS